MNTKKTTWLGNSPMQHPHGEVTGEFVDFLGETYFRIGNFDRMRPFFMTIVSSSDHWLFISSNGGLSAGRRTPDNALFPYYTDDKITDSAHITGAKSIIKVIKDNDVYIWEPLVDYSTNIYPSTSNIYKNREGNKIIFEQHNLQLGLTYRYGWMFSEEYGIIKRAWIVNNNNHAVKIELLDGIQNILPYGVDSGLQNLRSTLVDAYKRSELDEDSGLAIYSLSSMVVDKAEPSEALKASTVWSVGVEQNAILLCNHQLSAFKHGAEIQQELDIKAEKGAFFLHATLHLQPQGEKDWIIAGEVNQRHAEIELLRQALKNKQQLYRLVLNSILADKEALQRKIGLADGIQITADKLITSRHFSNVLFNIMRGGTFDDQYEIDTTDFRRHVNTLNKKSAKKYADILSGLPPTISYHQLRHFIAATKKPELLRFYFEYLPLSFSRRHGDPSRPWNYFTIETKEPDGKKYRNFEGNWRDIFQNWEALAFSFPEFSLGMISKFVNASTIDGYNPYRITRNGIDWERIEPDDPWSYIGYWGDHQVIYLTKLLELAHNHHPKRAAALMNEHIFTYANVPYRIKGYDAITSNPKDTIDFDHELDQRISKRVLEVGADGKLVWDSTGHPVKVSLTEKLLVMVLTKLYNFIPDAGIWLNTQRPEWNDANNALVGNGVSVVTLCYLRRLLQFTPNLFQDPSNSSFEINKPVVDLLDGLKRGFYNYREALSSGFTDERRRNIMDDFGVAGEHYRTTAYAGFTGEKRTLSSSQILSFFETAIAFIDKSIEYNERKDGLFHAYNLINLNEGRTSIGHLYEMLEGQVAVLSAKILPAHKALQVLDALKNSGMFRPDQYSYMLYPDRELLPFLKKNQIDPALIQRSKLIQTLLANGDITIVEQDVSGKVHFSGNFHNVNDLEHALDSLTDEKLKALLKAEKKLVLDAFELVFNHKLFTGRSGAFYGYEGLGSIYWHMVSKLLLAVQENICAASEKGADEEVVGRLIEHYYEIRAGIGVNKSPELYGAFPTDAYSHTPKNAGVQQPGMTGQVKEDIINRWVELGIVVEEGRLQFKPLFLRKSEFLNQTSLLGYFDAHGVPQIMAIGKGELAFTYCQTPVKYILSDKTEAKVIYQDNSSHNYLNARLTDEDSKHVFQRTGKINRIEVMVSRLID